MTFPNKIILPNRYNDNNYLELSTSFNEDGANIGMYKLVMEHELPFREGVMDGEFFIDPSGGPFLTTGYLLGNLEIVKILSYLDNICIKLKYSDNVL